MIKNDNPKVVAVVGPTGSGKTALAVALAKKFDGVLISADSRQVYRGLNVGTNKEGQSGEFQGKPARIIDGIPQLLIDVIGPGENFTLADWLSQAREALEEIWQAGKLPIVVGGTGLYVTALLEGYQPGEGRYSKKRQPVGFQSLILMPAVKKEVLGERSDSRYEKVFDELIKETKRLIDKGVTSDWLVKLGLDYRYAALYIIGERNRGLAIEEFQHASRAYIRRQLTWWRHHGRVESVKNTSEAEQKTAEFLREPEKLVE